MWFIFCWTEFIICHLKIWFGNLEFMRHLLLKVVTRKCPDMSVWGEMNSDTNTMSLSANHTSQHRLQTGIHFVFLGIFTHTINHSVQKYIEFISSCCVINQIFPANTHDPDHLPSSDYYQIWSDIIVKDLCPSHLLI